MIPKKVIDYYNNSSKDYDFVSKEHQWNSPEIMFGLLFEFVKKDEKMLDLGIGTGQSSIFFQRIGLKIYGIDGSKEMLQECEKKKFTEESKEFDLNQIPFPYDQDKFNHIIANGILYFFKDLEPFFKEAQRMLKNGGTFSFTFENQKKTEKDINKDDHLISERLVEKVGFKVYQHSQDYVENLINKYSFTILKKLDYLAYNSPTEKKDIYFQIYVLRKK